MVTLLKKAIGNSSENPPIDHDHFFSYCEVGLLPTCGYGTALLEKVIGIRISNLPETFKLLTDQIMTNLIQWLCLNSDSISVLIVANVKVLFIVKLY